MSRNTRLIALGLILLVGCVLRVAFAVQLAETPYLDNPILDAREYDLRAREIAAGQLVDEHAFFYGPLYSYVLGLLFAVFGSGPVWPRALNVALEVATTCCTYLAGRKVGGERLGLLAALGHALYLPSIFHSGLETMESLVTLLVTALAVLLLEAAAVRRDGIAFWLGAGLLGGLSVLARASHVLLLPLFLLALWNRRPQRPSPSAIAFIFGIGICVGASTLHNYLAEREAIPVTSSLGLNFYVGNNESADATWTGLPGSELSDFRGERFAEGETGRQMSSRELSSFFLQRGLAFVGEHPGRCAALVLERLVLFVKHYEVPHIYNMFLMRSQVALLRAPLLTFWLVSPLALVGLGLVLLRGPREARWLAAFALLYLASLLPFFVAGRLRLPIVPVLLVFAGRTAFELVDGLALRRFRTVVPLAVAVILVALFVSGGKRPAPPDEEPQFLDQLAQIQTGAGDAERAARTWEQVLRRFPGYGPAYTNLGTHHYRRGELPRAIELYEQALARSGRTTGRLYNLALAYAGAERLEQAVALCREIVAQDPDFGPAYSTLTVLHARLGRFDETVQAFRQYARTSEVNPASRAKIVSVLIENGRADLATVLIDAELSRTPDDPWLHCHRAELLLSRGDRSGARSALGRALELAPDFPFALELRKRLE